MELRKLAFKRRDTTLKQRLYRLGGGIAGGAVGTLVVTNDKRIKAGYAEKEYKKIIQHLVRKQLRAGKSRWGFLKDKKFWSASGRYHKTLLPILAPILLGSIAGEILVKKLEEN